MEAGMVAPLGSSAPVAPSSLSTLTFCLTVKGMKEQARGGLWQTPLLIAVDCVSLDYCLATTTVALSQPLCKTLLYE